MCVWAFRLNEPALNLLTFKPLTSNLPSFQNLEGFFEENSVDKKIFFQNYLHIQNISSTFASRFGLLAKKPERNVNKVIK